MALLLAAVPAAAATLTVRITGVEEPVGVLMVAVCNQSFDEQGCPHGASEPAVVPGRDVQFLDLEPGSYAVAVYQDLDGSGALNRNGLGLPTEPYGFSNDVGRMAPPSFTGALFELSGDRTVEIRVRPLFGG
jgi:uncharacterized protein (DUF2141 family)